MQICTNALSKCCGCMPKKIKLSEQKTLAMELIGGVGMVTNVLIFASISKMDLDNFGQFLVGGGSILGEFFSLMVVLLARTSANLYQENEELENQLSLEKKAHDETRQTRDTYQLVIADDQRREETQKNLEASVQALDRTSQQAFQRLGPLFVFAEQVGARMQQNSRALPQPTRRVELIENGGEEANERRIVEIREAEPMRPVVTTGCCGRGKPRLTPAARQAVDLELGQRQEVDESKNASS